MPAPGAATRISVGVLVGRVLGGVGAAALGALIGLLGAFHHSRGVRLGPVELPLGLLAGLLALVLAQVLSRAALPLVGPVLVLIGWLVVVAVLGSSRPEGDLAVPGGAHGEGFLYGGFLLGMATAFVLASRRGLQDRPD